MPRPGIKHIIIAAMLIIANPLGAQQPLVDSMQQLLKKDQPDSTRMLNMLRQAIFYEAVDTGKAHWQYAAVRAFAEKKKDLYYKGMSYRFEEVLYQSHGQHAAQLDNLEKAEDIYVRLPADRVAKELASVYKQIGSYYNSANDEKKAVQFYFKAIALAERNGLKGLLLDAYVDITAVYKRLGELDEMKEYSDKILALAKQINKPIRLFTGYVFEANYYQAVLDFGNTVIYLDSARPYFSERWGFNEIEAYLSIRAVSYQGLKRYDSAIHYYTLAYERAKKENAQWYMIQPMLMIGYNYLLQKKYDKSEPFLRKGLDAAIKDSSVLFQNQGYEYLSRLFAETNRYKDAYTSYKQFHELTDSLVGIGKKKYALDLKTKYETEKKEEEIRTLQAGKRITELELRQKNTLNYLLIAAAVVILLIGVLLSRNYHQKQALQQRRIAELETERQLTATGAILRGEEQERARLAKDLHDGLSGMLSGAKYSLQTMQGNLVMTPDSQQAFTRGMDMLDSSIREMRRVAQNMMPEALIRFGIDVVLRDYCTDINKVGLLHAVYQSMGTDDIHLEQTRSIAIFRVIQELINNVIKHAGASQVLVQLLKEGDKLVINVEDNGKGFDPAVLYSGRGMGWSNIRSRVDYLKGKIDIRAAPDAGTAINIELNLVS